jgi:hypothetical protein
MVRPPRPADEGASTNVFKVALYNDLKTTRPVFKVALFKMILILFFPINALQAHMHLLHKLGNAKTEANYHAYYQTL